MTYTFQVAGEDSFKWLCRTAALIAADYWRSDAPERPSFSNGRTAQEQLVALGIVFG
jgi:hypothetical protein